MEVDVWQLAIKKAVSSDSNEKESCLEISKQKIKFISRNPKQLLKKSAP